MIKNLFLASFLVLNLTGIIYPSKKENTTLFDYCYSLEKILSRNLIQKRENASRKVISISKDIAKFGVSKTQGSLINKMINQYKTSKNSKIINLVPNRFFCLAGYWFESVKPGIFESILYEKSKKEIYEFIDLKGKVDGIINDVNSEYKDIKKEFNSLF